MVVNSFVALGGAAVDGGTGAEGLVGGRSKPLPYGIYPYPVVHDYLALASTRGRSNGLVCAKRLCTTSSVNASKGIDTFSILRRRLWVRFLTGLVGNGLVCAKRLCTTSSVNASRGIDTFSILRRRLWVRFLTGLVGNGLVCTNGLVSG